MFVRYDGHRPEHKDSLYGTGEWVAGQVKDVPEATALKMFRHPDVYLPHEGEAGPVQAVEPASEADEKAKDEDQAQMARDSIAAMSTKEAVADYAMTNFGQKIPKTMSLENMKQQATILIDQFGV